MRIETSDIVFPELSYQIIGAAFSAFNELGWGLPEKAYSQALAEELKVLEIPFRREVYIPLAYKETIVSKYFADFIVADSVLLELKVVAKLGYTHTRQILGYLKSSRLKLGILLYFSVKRA